MPNKVLFGAAGVTSILPLTMAALVVAVLATLFFPRKYIFVPMVMISLLIPVGQVWMVGSFHFSVTRILLAAAWARVLIQRGKEGRDAKIRMNGIDKAIIGYALVSILTYSLQWEQSAAFFAQVGKSFTTLGLYFFFRFCIRGQEDVERAIRTLMVVASVVGILMINEQVTGRNVLSIFGGVPEFTAMRTGYLRSQGPFEVYLTAGAFGASLLPLFLSMWKRNGAHLLAGVGLCAAVAITVTSKTSTATSALAGALAAMALWFVRDNMQLVRWGIVTLLTGLHLVMKAPVWSLIQRVDLVGGSTGWHRFKIVDNCIRNFFEWWLVGNHNYMNREGGGDDMWDLANQYVLTAETFGLLSLIFFVATLVYAFKYLGRARLAAGSDTAKAWFLWLVGATLFANMVAFMGISYFDQTEVYWYLFMAIVVAATAPVIAGETVPEPVRSSRAEFEETWPDFELGANGITAREGAAGAFSLYGE